MYKRFFRIKEKKNLRFPNSQFRLCKATARQVPVTSYFKIFGVFSFLVLGLFLVVPFASADTCRCVGEEEGAESIWDRPTDDCEDDACVEICNDSAAEAVTVLDERVTCEPEDAGVGSEPPSVAGSAVGRCRCTGDGLGETIEVTGYTMSDLERECREGCESYGLYGERGVEFDHCSNSRAERSEEGERLCVLRSSVTPPGETKAEEETRTAPTRDCEVVNPDCMSRFPSENHIFFSNAECYCCGECSLDDFTNVFLGAADYLFGILGALALLFFIYGGVTWLTAGGSPERVDKGRKILIGAVVGIAICVGAWLLIDLLQQALGVKSQFRL
jgi:hypothetical protein